MAEELCRNNLGSRGRCGLVWNHPNACVPKAVAEKKCGGWLPQGRACVEGRGHPGPCRPYSGEDAERLRQEERLAEAPYQDGAGEVPFPQFRAWVLRLPARDRRYVLRTLEFVAGGVGDVAGELPLEFERIFRDLGRNPMTLREKEMIQAALGSLQKAVVDMATVARG